MYLETAARSGPIWRTPQRCQLTSHNVTPGRTHHGRPHRCGATRIQRASRGGARLMVKRVMSDLHVGKAGSRTAVARGFWLHTRRRCKHDNVHRSGGSAKRDRLRGVSRVWGLVVAPTTVCRVRPYWMLRQLAQPARDRACELVRPPCHTQFRARRGLVLGLPHKQIRGRASPRTPAASSRRSTRAWTSRTGPRQLARPFGGIVTTHWVATHTPAHSTST
jgi:hypothetical protein